MRKHIPRPPIALAMCLLAAAGCSQNETISVDPSSKMCNSDSGFGARIAGTVEPLEMCVPDDTAVTTFGVIGPNRYYIAADDVTADGAAISIEISFVLQPLTPADLNMTSNQSLAFIDPTAVWFHYREVKQGEYDYQSISSIGDFRLTVNDDAVAAAWFGNIRFELEDANGNDAGERTIAEGFISVIPDGS